MKQVKEVNIKIKDGIKAVIFNTENPPDFVHQSTHTEDDASGIFEFTDWVISNHKLHNGDLILYTEYGINRMTCIVIPKDAIDKLVEIIE